jgi:hypothetical protein
MPDEQKDHSAELNRAEKTVRDAGGVPVEVLYRDDGRIEISFVIAEGGSNRVHTFLCDRQESLTLLHNFVRSKIPRVIAVGRNNRGGK